MGPPCLTKSSSKFRILPNFVWFGLRPELPITLAIDWALAKLEELGISLASSSKSVSPCELCGSLTFPKCHKGSEHLHGYLQGLRITSSELGRLNSFSGPVNFLLCILCSFPLPNFISGCAAISYWFTVLKLILDTNFFLHLIFFLILLKIEQSE